MSTKYFILYWEKREPEYSPDPGQWVKSGNDIRNRLGWDDINVAYAEIEKYKQSSILQYIVVDDAALAKDIPPPAPVNQ